MVRGGTQLTRAFEDPANREIPRRTISDNIGSSSAGAPQRDCTWITTRSGSTIRACCDPIKSSAVFARSWDGARGLAAPRGVTVVLHWAAASRAPAQFSGTRGQEQAARQHRQQAPAASPKKKSTLEAPCRPVAAVARAIPEGSRGWFPWRRTAGRPCLPGRTPASPHLCRLSPCAVGFVQNPSSECPTIRLQGETKHYGVFGV